MSDFRERMTRRFLNGRREKHGFYSRMMCHRSLILLMNVFGQVKKCLGSLKSVEMFLSGFLLKTFYCWLNTVWMMSGMIKFAICRYDKGGLGLDCIICLQC